MTIDYLPSNYIPPNKEHILRAFTEKNSEKKPEKRLKMKKNISGDFAWWP